VLLTIGLLLAGYGGGFVSHKYGLFPVGVIRSLRSEAPEVASLPLPPGYWKHARSSRSTNSPDSELSEDERTALLSIPYLPGTEIGAEASGVTVFDESRAYAGYNLYVSGFGPEAVLMDMEGRLMHRWELPFEEAFPDLEPYDRTLCWRRARLLPDGGLLAIYEYAGIVRIDRESKKIWAYSERNHHDLDIDQEGSIYVLSQKNRRNPRSDALELIGDDVITILSDDGEVLREISIYDCFERSEYAPILERLAPRGDVFHTNTLTILDDTWEERSDVFMEGNLLISIKRLDTIAIIDPRAERVVWALSGLWSKQHQPVLLRNGHMLVFDNRPEATWSRVLELDPFSQQIIWEYRGDEQSPFYSEVGGSNQRLPNGNTLITETDFGRGLEVTPDGTIVWEFVNPRRAGENGEYIAALWEVERIALDDPVLAFVGDGSGGDWDQ
jgi:hypothetical protein